MGIELVTPRPTVVFKLPEEANTLVEILDWLNRMCTVYDHWVPQSENRCIVIMLPDEKHKRMLELQCNFLGVETFDTVQEFKDRNMQ